MVEFDKLRRVLVERQRVRSMVDELSQDVSDKLTPHDIEFLGNLENRMRLSITPGQVEHLENIWQKVFG